MGLIVRKPYPPFEDKDAFIASMIPVVASVARKYCPRRSDLEDLIGEGTIALLEAYDRFDPSRGVPFLGFALPGIRGAISDYLRDKSGAIRPSQKAYQVGAAILRSSLQDGTAAEIGASLGITTSQASMGLMSLRSQRQLSLDLPVPDGEYTWHDRIGSPDSFPDLWLGEFEKQLNPTESRLFALLKNEGNQLRKVMKHLGLSPVQAAEAVRELKHKFMSYMDIRERKAKPVGAANDTKTRKVTIQEAKQHGIKTVLDSIEWFTDTASPITPSIGVTSTGLNFNSAAAKQLGITLKQFIQVGYNADLKRIIIRKANAGVKLSKGYGDGSSGVCANSKRFSEWLSGKRIARRRYALEYDVTAEVYYLQVEITEEDKPK